MYVCEYMCAQIDKYVEAPWYGTHPYACFHAISHTDVCCWMSLVSFNAGWIAVPVAEDMLQKLSKLFVVTRPRELGTGRDAAKYSRAYKDLKSPGA